MSLFDRSISRRSLFGGVGGAVALSALAACGDNGASSNELSWWLHEYGEDGTLEAAKKYAGSYDKKDVELRWIRGDYGTQLSAGLLGNRGPDCFESQFNVNMVLSDQVVPLDDIIGDVKSDFNDYDLEPNTYDGKVYGIRMIDDPQLFYYRKSFFDDAGVSVPETVDDLVAAAKELTTDDVKGLYAGSEADSGAGGLGGVGLFSTGHRYLTDDHQDVDYVNDEYAEVLSKLRQLVEDKSTLTGATTDWTNPQSFLDGKVAIQWCGLWAMPQVIDALKDDFGVFPFPKGSANGSPATYSGGWTSFVSAKSDKVDDAKAFTKWLWIEQSEYQEDWSLSYGFHIPPRKSLAEKADKLKSGPAAEVVELNSQYGVGDNPYWNVPAVNAPFADVVTNVVQKGNDPMGELEKAAEKSREELQKLNDKA